MAVRALSGWCSFEFGFSSCRVSSSVPPRKPSKPAGRSEAFPFRGSSLLSFPNRSRSLRQGLNGYMRSSSTAIVWPRASTTAVTQHSCQPSASAANLCASRYAGPSKTAFGSLTRQLCSLERRENDSSDWARRAKSSRSCPFSIQKSTIRRRRSKYKPHPGQAAIRRKLFARIRRRQPSRNHVRCRFRCSSSNVSLSISSPTGPSIT